MRRAPAPAISPSAPLEWRAFDFPGHPCPDMVHGADRSVVLSGYVWPHTIVVRRVDGARLDGWKRVLSDVSSIEAAGATVDDEGRTWVAGSFEGALLLDGRSILEASVRAGFVVVFDASGALAAARAYAGQLIHALACCGDAVKLAGVRDTGALYVARIDPDSMIAQPIEIDGRGRVESLASEGWIDCVGIARDGVAEISYVDHRSGARWIREAGTACAVRSGAVVAVGEGKSVTVFDAEGAVSRAFAPPCLVRRVVWSTDRTVVLSGTLAKGGAELLRLDVHTGAFARLRLLRLANMFGPPVIAGNGRDEIVVGVLSSSMKKKLARLTDAHFGRDEGILEPPPPSRSGEDMPLQWRIDRPRSNARR